MTKDKLQAILEAEYKITPQILEKSAWGYNTVAYYVQQDAKEYVAKVTPFTESRSAGCQKDVRLSALFSSVLPTPVYLKNTNGEYLTLSSGLIVRVASYLRGTSPFEMTLPVYRQLLKYLEVLHKIPVTELWSDLKDLNLPVLEDTRIVLHGDLTPSNVIVADNSIVGVLDFEDSLLGPVEYDLARSAVFCWFRMKEAGFKFVFDYTLQEYSGLVDKMKLLNYCVQHAQNHVSQVVNNKEKYDDAVFWQDDYNFSTKALAEIKTVGA